MPGDAAAPVDVLVVSNILLWCAVVALGAIVVALVRQIGVLHQRIAPVGALAVSGGPEVGEPAPRMSVGDRTGGQVEVGGARAHGRATLLFFLSPTCPVCKTLLPALRAAVRTEAGRVDLVLASDGADEDHAGFARRERIDDLPYVLSTELGLALGVAKLPYAVLIDADGIVRAKGLVNTREHIESLFEARRLGVASIQDWVSERRAEGAA